ncbi:MAG: hypothetical protein CL678_08745 [Bdellovibrionaceae bacterium]|nr:hypothetical protein [Pseudobdellovibrionaceae bacterium]|tara:strand:+ start:5272 stop:5856 length:585 start_codon:yes stop_codon:yes gene_type:complete
MTVDEKKSKKINILNILTPLAGVTLLIWMGLSALESYFEKQNVHLGHLHGVIKKGQVIENFPLSEGRKKIVQFYDFKSKVIVINFWATWCPGCIVEMPSLIRLKKQYESDGLKLVLVNLDDEPEEDIKTFKEKFNINFDLYFDVQAEASKKFEVSAIPLTVILDQNHKVIAYQVGERDWFDSSVRSLIEKHLSL